MSSSFPRVRSFGWFARAYHSRKDLLVAGAAAKISRESFADFRVARMRMPLDQCYRGDHHPRCADAALRAAAFEERCLHSVKLRATGDSLDRANVRAIGFEGRDQTTVDDRAV